MLLQKARLRALVESTVTAIWYTDAIGAVVEEMPGWQALTGFTFEQTRGFGWLASIHPDDRARVGEIWNESCRTETTFEAAYRLLRHDGEFIEVVARGVPLRDAQGAVTGWVGSTTDVTEQRAAERERTAAEESLRQLTFELVETQRLARLGTWTRDLEKGTTVRSAELYRILGLAPEMAQGPTQLDTLDLVHPEDRPGLELKFAAAIRDGEAFEATVRVRRPDGVTVNLLVNSHVIRQNGKPVRLVGVVRDVTEAIRAVEERRLFEAKMLQAQKMESLGMLAGGIAHDFNNLLVGILGNASFVRTELPVDSAAGEAIADLEVTARRAADLARQLLAYSGKGRFVVQPLDLSAIVDEMRTMLATVISKKATLRLETPGNLPRVNGDATQMRQVLMNLITNASDALQDRSGVITVRTGTLLAEGDSLRSEYLDAQLTPGEYVFVEVSDTGVGMTREVASRIFDPFFTTKHTGHGLGLAAALGIIRGHQGTVKVYSESGRGTAVKVLLPALSPPARSASPGVEAEGRNITVLVVDDDDGVRRFTRRGLERAGYRVLQVASGREAIDTVTARLGGVDIVLLDLSMPEMSGEETFQHLRRISPGLPIVLTSGYNEQDASSAFVGRGLAGFIQKPFSVQELLAVLTKTIVAAKVLSNDTPPSPSVG